MLVNTCIKKATIQTVETVTLYSLKTHCFILKKATSVSNEKYGNEIITMTIVKKISNKMRVIFRPFLRIIVIYI